MVKQAARNATKKKGAVTKKKTVTKAKQKKEQDHHHASSSSSPSIRSKFVGVTWYKREKKWQVRIKIDGKTKTVGYFDDEKEAACKYDEQAALYNRFVNFPQHEGQEQVVKRALDRDRSMVPDMMRQSKFVGVSWYKQIKKWQVKIRIDGKSKNLGYFDDEKEAACKYDEQAALLNKPVNFPQHEGQEQAVKPAPAGSPLCKYKSRAKSSKDDDGYEDEEEVMEEESDSDEEDEDEEYLIIPDQQDSSSSSAPTFLQHLVHQQATFLQVKQELIEDLEEEIR